MKKLLLLSLFVLAGFSSAFAQAEVRVTVENQRIVGGNFYFDVMMQDTLASSPFFLGYADIVLTNVLPAGAFSSPIISYINNTTTLLNEDGTTATGYNASTVNPALGSGANANRIIINVDFPAFSNQTEFDDRVAKIDGISRRLGTFMVSTNTQNAFVPNHAFHTAGAGIKTKIYEAAATTPWNQTRITSTNAYLVTSAIALDNAPATFPAEFPSNFAETINSSTSITLNWTNGTHDGVILLYRLSNSATNTTIGGLGSDTTVANTLAYLGNSDWAAAIAADTNKVGTSPYAVAYVGSGTNVTLTNLVAGEQYKYVLIPYNGVLGFNVAYADPTIMATNSNALTIDRPSVLVAPTWTVAAVAMFNTPSASSTSMDINWYIDDFTNIATNDVNYNAGNDSILFVAIGAASPSPTVAPALGNIYLPTVGKSYTPNATFGSGDSVGPAPVARVVGRALANAASGTVTFSGLTAETSYRIYAIPMRGNPNAVNAANYNLAVAVQQDIRFTTPTPVTAPDAGDLIASFTGAQDGAAGVNFTWTLPTNGGYTGLIILAREATATTFEPVNGVVYTGNADFSAAPAAAVGQKVVFSGSGTSANITGLNPNQRYHFTAIPYKGSAADSNLAYTSDGPTNVWARSNEHTWMTVAMKANLGGAWTGSANATGLAIPANQPYNTAAYFNYNGTETYDANVTPNAVDWVLLEVRRTNINATVNDATLAAVPSSGAPNVGRRAALLLANGDIVDPANNQSILFQIAQEGEYYVVVYHRNHLPIMTAAAADTGNNVVAATGDLTVPANVLGTNTDNFIETSSVAFMVPGNANTANFAIDAADRTAIWAARNQSSPTLYILEDVKFDGDDLGEVDASDRAVVWNNRTKSAAALITTP